MENNSLSVEPTREDLELALKIIAESKKSPVIVAPAVDVTPVIEKPKPTKPTSIDDLKKFSNGTLLELPPFADGCDFVALVRRPSMLRLAKEKKIPNSLLSAAGNLFNKGSKVADDNNEHMLEDMFSVMEVICEAALVSPTYEELKNAGILLTDDQMMAIFSYSQVGVKALESFR